MVSNVNAAMGVLLGAREVGLKVPDQLSVVAIHDSWFTEYASPSLTTVRMPMYEMGREAVRLLHLRLEGERPVDVMIEAPEPELVHRQSTAPPPKRLARAREPIPGPAWASALGPEALFLRNQPALVPHPREQLDRLRDPVADRRDGDGAERGQRIVGDLLGERERRTLDGDPRAGAGDPGVDLG